MLNVCVFDNWEKCSESIGYCRVYYWEFHLRSLLEISENLSKHKFNKFGKSSGMKILRYPRILDTGNLLVEKEDIRGNFACSKLNIGTHQEVFISGKTLIEISRRVLLGRIQQKDSTILT